MDVATLALIVGLVGSLTGVASLAWHVYAHVTDRGRLEIVVSRGTHHNQEDEIIKYEIRCVVTNVGRRPIIVTNVTQWYSDYGAPNRDIGLSMGETERKVPKELMPGHYILLVEEERYETLGPIRNVTANDSLGNKYQLSRKDRRDLSSAE